MLRKLQRYIVNQEPHVTTHAVCRILFQCFLDLDNQDSIENWCIHKGMLVMASKCLTRLKMVK